MPLHTNPIDIMSTYDYRLHYDSFLANTAITDMVNELYLMSAISGKHGTACSWRNIKLHKYYAMAVRSFISLVYSDLYGYILLQITD